MEVLLALVIGVLCGAGVWLVLRPRTFQVVMGLALLSYAVNLSFTWAASSSTSPDHNDRLAADRRRHRSDAEALVSPLVIGFATTALFLVVLLASRGLSGTDHVDGEQEPP